MSANWGGSSGCVHFSYQFCFVRLIITQKKSSIFKRWCTLAIIRTFIPDIYSRHLFIGLTNGFFQEYFGIYVHINIFQIVRFLCSIVFMFVFLRDLQRNFLNKGFSQWVCVMVSTRVCVMVSARVCARVSAKVCVMVSVIYSGQIFRTLFSHTSISRSEWGIESSVYEKKNKFSVPSLLFYKLSELFVPWFLSLFFKGTCR